MGLKNCPQLSLKETFYTLASSFKTVKKVLIVLFGFLENYPLAFYPSLDDGHYWRICVWRFVWIIFRFLSVNR